MLTDPRDVLAQRAAEAPAPGITPGSSGYFTAPTQSLDPNLFEGETLLPGVRDWILKVGYWFLDHDAGFKGSHTWATIWIAGSGITYQWSAARSPGDLDILVGVKTSVFKKHNPAWNGASDVEIAHAITEQFRRLGEATSRQSLGSGIYEVTWYVNPGAEDIRDIRPYAAYDVTHGGWTVPPPQLPGDWGDRYFPAHWWAEIGQERKRANELINDFLAQRAVYLGAHNDAQRINAATSLNYTAVLARTLFDDIHDQRRTAFGPQGNGYSDWFNFRWQAHKRNGVVPALHALADLQKASVEQSQQEIYGHPLVSTEQALSTASLLHAHLNSLGVR